MLDKIMEVVCKTCDTACYMDCECPRRKEIEAIVNEHTKEGKRPRRRIRCVTTDMEFDTLREAGEYYGVQPATISKCLKGQLYHAGRFAGITLNWEYID